MIRFLYTTDSHGRWSNPAARLDDFPYTILKKFEYINHLAEELDVAAILHGGDWVESPDVSNTFVSELASILTRSKKPWYGILGNHDVYGQNPETFKKTPLAIAVAAGAFTRLSEVPTIFYDGEDKAAITGKDSYFDLDKKIDREDYTILERVPNAVNIRLVHGMLDDHKWMDNVDSTSIDEIINTKADIILTGHIHPGYGVIKKNYKIFCNPNALARVSASVGDVNLEVRVALITIANQSFDVELIPFPVSIARPANEIIDRAKLEAEKEHKRQLQNFKDGLKTDTIVTDGRAFEPYYVLDAIAKEDGLDENIVTMTRERLGRAEEQLKKGEEEQDTVIDYNSGVSVTAQKAFTYNETVDRLHKGK
jgi:DNA repair exonuclease SbcCD nuclease subunit